MVEQLKLKEIPKCLVCGKELVQEKSYWNFNSINGNIQGPFCVEHRNAQELKEDKE
jgi:hypothetical protein